MVVAAELAAEASVAARSAAVEASVAAMVADSAVVTAAFAEAMAVTVLDAGTGAVSDLASVGAGPDIGPVTRMDTLMVMDILTPTDTRVITDTIRMLTPDSKHTDPLLLIKRHLLPTAAQ